MPAITAGEGGRARAGVTLEERKMPMRFSWIACQPNCRGWVSAVGIVTADSPRDFDEFARGRQLGGTTIVLDSSGGSVNDSIALGRRWRSLGALTNLVTTDMVAQPGSPNAAVVELTPKPVQDRFVSSAVATETNPEPAKSTKTAEAMGPTGGVRAAA